MHDVPFARIPIWTWTNQNEIEKKLFLMWSDINSKLLFWNGHFLSNFILYLVSRHLLHCPHWTTHDKPKRSMSILLFVSVLNAIISCFSAHFYEFNPCDQMCTMYNVQVEFLFRNELKSFNAFSRCLALDSIIRIELALKIENWKKKMKETKKSYEFYTNKWQKDYELRYVHKIRLCCCGIFKH